MSGLMNLVNEYIELEILKNSISEYISEILNNNIVYNGKECTVVSMDILDKSVVIKSLDESNITEQGEYKTISMYEYEKYLEIFE